MIEPTEPNHDHLDSPAWVEHTKRKQAWSENPDRDKIRRAANAVIKKRIGEIVEPIGFRPVDKGVGWELEKGLKVRGISIQRSNYGYCCYLNIFKRHRFGWLERLSTKKPEVRRLGAFYEVVNDSERVGELGALYYYEVEQGAQYVDEAFGVLAKKAVPWMLE